jgi:hypothetical protein
MDTLPIRVLLVDDDEDDFVMTRDMLAELGRGAFSLSTGSPPTRRRARRSAGAITTSTCWTTASARGAGWTCCAKRAARLSPPQ